MESVVFFHYLESGDSAQVIRLGGKGLPLSHLKRPLLQSHWDWGHSITCPRPQREPANQQNQNLHFILALLASLLSTHHRKNSSSSPHTVRGGCLNTVGCGTHNMIPSWQKLWWFEREPSPTVSCSWTLGHQLVVLFGELMEPSGAEPC